MSFGLDASTKVFLYSKPCDMRKGFDGLFGLVQNEMELNPLSGYLFVFISKDRNKVKILFWDKDGLVLFCKRLEKGTFKRPTANIHPPNSELSQEEIYMILRGMDLRKPRKESGI